MHGPHDRVPVEVLVLRSVHHHGVQLALRFRWSSARSRSKAHPPHVSLLSQPDTRPGIRPVIRDSTGWKDRCVALSRFPAAFRLPAFASWASCSRHGIPLPSRSAYHHSQCDGPDGVTTFHTHEIRPGRVPAIPRAQRCPLDHRTMLSRRLPILNGTLLIIPTSPTRP